ncbi:hypothetical protein NX059_010487 [Plenodomus lindquistii]|nr:hypothetical protein NX059_010487 [Plenodomus lindquistii]
MFKVENGGWDLWRGPTFKLGLEPEPEPEPEPKLDLEPCSDRPNRLAAELLTNAETKKDELHLSGHRAGGVSPVDGCRCCHQRTSRWHGQRDQAEQLHNS